MRTERLVALNAFPYAGKSLNKGDMFLAEPEHAKILKAIGRAEDDSTPAMTEAQPKASPVVIEPAPEVKVQPPWQASAKAAGKPKKTQE